VNINDLLESAWTLIANANEGNWDKATPEWRAAAICWRDKYHETLPDSPNTPEEHDPKTDWGKQNQRYTLGP